MAPAPPGRRGAAHARAGRRIPPLQRALPRQRQAAYGRLAGRGAQGPVRAQGPGRCRWWGAGHAVSPHPAPDPPPARSGDGLELQRGGDLAGATRAGWLVRSSTPCNAESVRRWSMARVSSDALARPRPAPTSSSCGPRCGRSRRTRAGYQPTTQPSRRCAAWCSNARSPAPRSRRGDQFLARGFTVHETCLCQGRDVWEFMHSAAHAFIASTAPPSLRPRVGPVAVAPGG